MKTSKLSRTQLITTQREVLVAYSADPGNELLAEKLIMLENELGAQER